MAHVFRVSDFCDCFSFVKQLYDSLSDSEDEMLFFRGLSDASFADIPSLFVTEKNGKTESELYHSLLLERPEEFDTRKHLSTLAKMQHYFSKTRMMDVTTNILDAIYFACTDFYDRDCKVIAYKVKKKDILHSNSDRALMLSCLPPLKESDKNQIRDFCLSRRGQVLDENSIRSNPGMIHLLHEICGECPAFKCAINTNDLLSSFFVLANKDNERSRIQSGYFVIAGLAGINAFQSYVDSVKEATIIIKASNKKKIESELKILGIDDAHIYPSLDRVALNIRNKRLISK